MSTETAAPPTDGLASKTRDRALILGAIAAILWLATIAVILTDVALNDRIPNDVGIGLAVLAGTASVIAVVLYVGVILLHRIEEVEAELSQTRAAPTEALATLRVPASAAALVRLQERVAAGGGRRALDQSEYYQVYTDVLLDLCGLRGDDDGTAEPAPN